MFFSYEKPRTRMPEFKKLLELNQYFQETSQIMNHY